MSNYLKSFWKYYLLRNPKLLLSLILTFIVYFWINKITNVFYTDLPYRIQLYELGAFHEGIYFIFIKPLFVYISGLIIINKI